MNKRIAEKQEYPAGGERQKYAGNEFKTEGVAQTLHVAASDELCAEDARAGDGAEDNEVENEDKLVRDRNAGHFDLTYLPYHKVIEHIHEVRDEILYEYRDNENENVFIEFFIAYQTF